MSDPAIPAAEPAPEHETASILSVAVEDIEAALAKVEHDIIGQAHALYQSVKALVDKAKAAV